MRWSGQLLTTDVCLYPPPTDTDAPKSMEMLPLSRRPLFMLPAPPVLKEPLRRPGGGAAVALPPPPPHPCPVWLVMMLLLWHIKLVLFLFLLLVLL